MLRKAVVFSFFVVLLVRISVDLQHFLVIYFIDVFTLHTLIDHRRRVLMRLYEGRILIILEEEHVIL